MADRGRNRQILSVDEDPLAFFFLPPSLLGDREDLTARRHIQIGQRPVQSFECLGELLHSLDCLADATEPCYLTYVLLPLEAG